MKVLQIDDSPQICEMYEEMFSADNNTMQSANDGKTGLQLILKNDFDLILLDIRMPEYSGIDLLKDLKEQRPSELRKIVITSLLEFSEAQYDELMNFGIHSIEKKPSSFQQIETLQKKVSQKEKRSTLRILIIDDKPENTTRFSEFFKSKGIQTTVSNDSWEGFHFIQQEQFDVILLNMYMPNFSGEQIIKMLSTDEKLHYQNIFILPAPFDHNNHIKDLLKRDGINGCLEKQMNLEEILKIIIQDFNLEKNTTPEIA